MEAKKTLGLVGMFFFSLFLINFVSADVEVSYEVYYGVIGDDLTFSETSIDVSDFSVTGYSCSSSSCSPLNIVPSLTGSSSSNEITLIYPEHLVDDSYTLYFQKDGYIGWEQSEISWHGEGVLGEKQKVYLSRKTVGYAPIQNLNVVNEIHPGIPLEVDFEVGIDADTYSAIMDNTDSGIDYGESVETEVVLNIYDDSGNKIYTEKKILDIPYSGKETVEFEYIFTEVGLKNIELITDVVDDKILLSLPQSATADVRVIEQGKLDYSYSILNGLEMNPLQPEVGETVSFSIDYLSKYIDGFGTMSDIGTDLEIVFILNGNVEESSDVSLTTDGTHYFDYIFPEGGFWEVKVTGNPNPQIGDFVEDSRSLVFFVFDNSNNDTNVSYDYFAFLENLEYTTTNLEDGEDYSFMFDYEFRMIDSLGNQSLMDGSLNLVIKLDGVVVNNLNYLLSGQGVFDYEFEVTDGDYVIDLELCPTVYGNKVGHCQYRTLTFNVDEREDDCTNCGGKRRSSRGHNLDNGISIQTNGLLVDGGSIVLGGFEDSKKKSDYLIFIPIILSLLILILLIVLLLLTKKII